MVATLPLRKRLPRTVALAALLVTTLVVTLVATLVARAFADRQENLDERPFKLEGWEYGRILPPGAPALECRGAGNGTWFRCGTGH